MKLANAVVDASAPTSVPYPPKTKNCQREIELVVAGDLRRGEIQGLGAIEVQVTG